MLASVFLYAMIERMEHLLFPGSEEISIWFEHFLPKVVIALLVLVAFYLFSRISRKGLRRVLRRTHMEEKLIELLIDKVYSTTIIILGLVMAASQLGVNVGAALAGLGVVGIAIGFAAQDTLANVIAGFMIFWDKPFGLGDWITVEQKYGMVTNITLRTTRIRTRSNTFIVIPNKTIIDEMIVNHSKHGESRIDIPVGIAYKESIDEARNVLLKAVSSIDGVMSEPEPDVVIDELGDSSVNMRVRVWVEIAEREKPVFFQCIEACKKALDEAGIEIPFPQRDVHMKKK